MGSTANFFAFFLLSCVIISNADDTIGAVEQVNFKGRIFAYFEDGVDEAIVLQSEDGTVELTPDSQEQKIAGQGKSNEGEFNMELMHRNTTERSFQKVVSGYALVAHFFANKDTTLAYEKGGTIFTSKSGNGRVQVSRDGNNLQIHYKGTLYFDEKNK